MHFIIFHFYICFYTLCIMQMSKNLQKNNVTHACLSWQWDIGGRHWSYRAVASQISLLNYCEKIYNCMISLAASRVKQHWWNEWFNAIACRTRLEWGRTWGRRHVYHAFAHASVFRLPIPPHHAHCSRELNERADTTTIQHLSSTPSFIHCGSACVRRELESRTQ